MERHSKCLAVRFQNNHSREQRRKAISIADWKSTYCCDYRVQRAQYRDEQHERLDSRTEENCCFDLQCRKKGKEEHRAGDLSTASVPRKRPYPDRQDTLLAGDPSDPSRTADRARDRGLRISNRRRPPFSSLAAAARSKVQRLCRRPARHFHGEHGSVGAVFSDQVAGEYGLASLPMRRKGPGR